jgi:hypothetical protein
VELHQEVHLLLVLHSQPSQLLPPRFLHWLQQRLLLLRLLRPPPQRSQHLLQKMLPMLRHFQRHQPPMPLLKKLQLRSLLPLLLLLDLRQPLPQQLQLSRLLSQLSSSYQLLLQRLPMLMLRQQQLSRHQLLRLQPQLIPQLLLLLHRSRPLPPLLLKLRCC